MARLRVTFDNRLLNVGGGPVDASADDVATLVQGYDGGWNIAHGANVQGLDLPTIDVPTRAALIEAIRAAGHDVEVEETDRTGSGQ